MTYLPSIAIPDQISRGRNIHDGYQRGWGLQYSNVAKNIQADPDFVRASAIVHDRIALIHPARLMNLFLISKFFLPKLPHGNIIEFGSYRCGSAMFMAAVCPDRQVYALDTFAGMPETNARIDMHKQGDFGDVNFNEINCRVEAAHLHNLILVKGRFDDTIPALLQTIGRIALAHIDCDIKSAVTYSFNAIKHYMVEGGYYVFDDATEPSCMGATESVEEIIQLGYFSEQIFPHFVLREGLAI